MRAWPHLLDLIVFRTAAAALIYHEVWVTDDAQRDVLVFALGMFFMPDWLRGRRSLPALLLRKLATSLEEEA